MPVISIDLGVLSAKEFGTHRHRYSQHDVALYALSLGCTEKDLRLVYERQAGFLALPPYLCASVVQASHLVPLRDILPDFDPRQLLHGEMFTEFLSPLPVNGTLVHTPQLISLIDKKAAVVVSAVRTSDDSGCPLAYTESTVFVRNTGRFKASRPVVSRHHDATALNTPPHCPPDFKASAPTKHDAAALYRLASQDLNPLHIDPVVAAEAGFARPILHGMATVGIAVRCLMQEFCKSGRLSSDSATSDSIASGCATSEAGASDLADRMDVAQLRSVKARFAGHVFPGETLVIEAWREPRTEITTDAKQASKAALRERMIFRVTTLERGSVALSHAAIVVAPLVLTQARL